MKKILVPIDSSESSKLAIAKAKELAKQFKSKLVLLHVVDTTSFSVMLGGYTDTQTTVGGMPYVTPMTIVQDEHMKVNVKEMAEKVMDSARAACMSLGDKVSEVKLEGHPADRIVEFVDSDKEIDLVVMGSYGMSGFRRFFLGSVTHKVALSIDRPILIVR